MSDLSIERLVREARRNGLTMQLFVRLGGSLTREEWIQARDELIPRARPCPKFYCGAPAGEPCRDVRLTDHDVPHPFRALSELTFALQAVHAARWHWAEREDAISQ